MIAKIIKRLTLGLIILILISISTVIIIGGGFGKSSNMTLLNEGKPIIFAHRGVTSNCIENSMESFNQGVKYGFKAVETDISLTKDQQLVIFHDKSCKRLLGIDAKIHELNYAEIKDKPLIKKII